MRPLFSIIIPVYNAAEYLQECLESIIAQDYQDWEAVLVDDASTDDSISIANHFGDSDHRIKIFKSEKNSGSAYHPRMKAAELATGQYLVTIDADDKVENDYLSILYKCIECLNADLVTTEMWKLIGNDAYRILPEESLKVGMTWEGKHLIERTLCTWDISMNGFAIRRNIYIKADSKISNEDKKSIFADELLSRWVLFMSPKVAICNARYYYRQNSESITHINIPRFIDSRMLTCDSLINMTEETFGENSQTHNRACENKFYAAVDLLRLINQSHLSRAPKKAAIKRLASSMRDFDLQKLKGRVSPRYLAIMRLPIPIARIAFKILDPLIKLKNGI